MGSVTRGQVDKLRSYLVGEHANQDGEWYMHCPLHEDTNRSSSLNIKTGQWYCFACDKGMNVAQLLRQVGGSNGNTPHAASPAPQAGPAATMTQVTQWVRNRQAVTQPLTAKRGISQKILDRYRIGWDDTSNAYTIPVLDAQGTIANVRRYQINPPDGRRKIWSVSGHGSAALYPIDQLKYNTIVICEGEWDALATIDRGINALTKTGGAKNWNKAWNPLFAGKHVLICHDADTVGVAANHKVANNLREYAASVTIVELPYSITDSDGKDLTDYWNDDHTADDFWALTRHTEPPDPVTQVEVSVLDSFSSEHYGRELGMLVTITGKNSDGFLVPRNIDLRCTMDAGRKCEGCVMNTQNGFMSDEILEHDPVVLKIIQSTDSQRHELLRERCRITKCDRLTIDYASTHSVEKLSVRSSIDSRISGASSHVNRQIISVGRHDTMPNTTVQVKGRIYPDPRDQHNVFLAHEVYKTDTSIDTFTLTQEIAERLKVFQTDERPLAKMASIADELANHVTKIYGRREVHMLFDLVFHSVLAWNFDGSLQPRGWVEALLLGDTRTGKSEVASALTRHYGLGEVVSCESASYAGVVGGLQQIGGKEWEITWGVVPLNDRRAVVLDEISGLTTEQIAQMSSIRSSGVAELTKIRTERTNARTRMLWMGNPRNAKMSDFTYAIHAIRPLVGNNEDIARFDCVMSIAMGEVPSHIINQHHQATGGLTYTDQACHDLLLWAWSRTEDQVHWSADATQYTYAQAVELGKFYSEDLPLIQAANVRVKLARLAVAIASRTFNVMPDDPETIHVEVRHVKDAVWFLNHIYGMGNFGYKQQSEEANKDLRIANSSRKKARAVLQREPGTAKFLRTTYGTFRINDLMDMMAYTREEASSLVNELWQLRMIRRQGAHIKIMPILHEIIREDL